MMQVIPQTHDEKVKMYMKCSKRELTEMLINSNDALGWALSRPKELSKPYLGTTYTYSTSIGSAR